MTELPLLIEPEFLAQHLGDRDLLVVDLSKADTHRQLHIPGAVFLDYGHIVAYRSPAGPGVRLDAGTAYSGAVIGRHYDSLLVKITASGVSEAEGLPTRWSRDEGVVWVRELAGVSTATPTSSGPTGVT